MRKICRVLYTELFYAIIPFFFAVLLRIPTSPYILPRHDSLYSSILDSIHSALETAHSVTMTSSATPFSSFVRMRREQL